jgi:hypothetical protein
MSNSLHTLATGIGTMSLLGLALPIARDLRHVRAEEMPALGWRIDLEQQAIGTMSLRFALLVALITIAILLARYIIGQLRVRTMRHASPRNVPTSDGSLHVFVAGVVVVSTIGIGLINTTVGSFSETAIATAALVSRDFDAAPPDLPGTTETFVQEFDWTKQVLGQSATYRRFRYDGDDAQPLWIDVMTTADADALTYHSVSNCYDFHGYRIQGQHRIAIGAGASAYIVDYVKPDVNEAWSTLYWEQRIIRNGRPFFQRIVMLYNLNVPSGDGATRSQFEPNDQHLQYRAEQVYRRLILEGGPAPAGI